MVNFLFSPPSSPFLSSPEPHILLFRRELGTDPNTGRIDSNLRAKQIDEYNKEFGTQVNVNMNTNK